MKAGLAAEMQWRQACQPKYNEGWLISRNTNEGLACLPKCKWRLACQPKYNEGWLGCRNANGFNRSVNVLKEIVCWCFKNVGHQVNKPRHLVEVCEELSGT